MSSVVREAVPAYGGLAVSREEYLDLPEDGFKYDVIEGVMRVSPSASSDHGSAQGGFIQALRNYLDSHAVGRAFVEVDIFLPDGGDPLRPDVSFVSTERSAIVKQHIHGTPDLVCEVLSDSTAQRDLGVKAERYLTCGVSEYWIVDPRNQTVQAWCNRKDTWEKRTGDSPASELLPGFTVAAARIFRD